MNTFKFIWEFVKSPELSRLRTFTVWAIGCSLPTLSIILYTLKYQTYLPNDRDDILQYVLSMMAGVSIVPTLFLFTNGLRGYHKTFNLVISKIALLFKFKDLEEDEQNKSLLQDLETARAVLGFLSLEFIIIGWDVMIYIFSKNNMSGLSLFGFMSDNLLVGAFIFILEASNVVWRGALALPKLYTLGKNNE